MFFNVFVRPSFLTSGSSRNGKWKRGCGLCASTVWKSRRVGRVLTLLVSIFIGRKPDFRSVTLDLQQTPTARRRRRADSELSSRSSFSLPRLVKSACCVLFSASVHLHFLCFCVSLFISSSLDIPPHQSALSSHCRNPKF